MIAPSRINWVQRMVINMKKFLCAIAVLAMLLSLAACGRRGAEGAGEASTAPPASAQPSGPDAALSAALAKLLAGHSADTWRRHIDRAQVYQQGKLSRAEITLKAGSTKYAEASVGLAGLFNEEQLDAFFPGLCGAAEELELSVADVLALGKLFYNLTTQDDARNYDQIEKLGLPVFQLLADITGEKVSKIKADIENRIVDDAKVAEVLFQALDGAYAKQSGEIKQSEMTQIAGTILTEFQAARIGEVVMLNANGTVIKKIG